MVNFATIYAFCTSMPAANVPANVCSCWLIRALNLATASNTLTACICQCDSYHDVLVATMMKYTDMRRSRKFCQRGSNAESLSVRVGLDKSVHRITDWRHEASLVMTNGDREGKIFSIPSSHE